MQRDIDEPALPNAPEPPPRLKHVGAQPQPSQAFIEEMNQEIALPQQPASIPAPVDTMTGAAPPTAGISPQPVIVQPRQPRTYDTGSIYPSVTNLRPDGLAGPEPPAKKESVPPPRQYFRKRRILLATMLLVSVVSGGVWYALLREQRPNVGYSQHIVDTATHSYSVEFDAKAKEITRNGRTFLSGRDLRGQQTLLVEVGVSAYANKECEANGDQGGSIRVVSRERIGDSDYNLCYAGSVNSYQLNFQHDNQWYYVAVVPQYKTQNIDATSVKQIVRSAHVVKE